MNEPTKAIIKAGLRSIAASIPVAASLGQAWNEYDSYQRNQRVEELFDNLKVLFGKLEQRLNAVEEYCKISGEFPALLEKVIEKIQREPSATKRRLFALALANGLATGRDQTFDTKVTIVETLDSLTESDLKILMVFACGKRIQVDQLVSSSQFYREEEALGEDASTLITALSKLESRGLISKTVPLNRAFDYPGEASHWINRWRRKTYELIPFGRVFLQALRETELSDSSQIELNG